jgi:hypothetical protein
VLNPFPLATKVFHHYVQNGFLNIKWVKIIRDAILEYHFFDKQGNAIKGIKTLSEVLSFFLLSTFNVSSLTTLFFGCKIFQSC